MMRVRLLGVLSVVYLATALSLTAGVVAATPAFAADPSCKQVTHSIVQTAVQDVLQTAIEQKPELKQLDQATLVKQAGQLFLSAGRPDLKAYGYMMLLWYGDETDRNLVAASAGSLKTETERAHFYFVFGLYKLASRNRELAAEGRAEIVQIRMRGDVEFVPDEMWDVLIGGCELAGS